MEKSVGLCFAATMFPVFGTLLPLVIDHVVQLNKTFTILHAVFMSSGSSEMDRNVFCFICSEAYI